MREYELVLMLDPNLDAPARDRVAQEARGQIESGGKLEHENVWGLRKLAFEIERRTEADYRWFRFQAPTELLEQLDHSLKIADGVLRFRIFKVDPEAPVMAPPAAAATRDRAPSETAEAAPAEAAPAEDSEAAAEPVAETAAGTPGESGE